MLHAKQLENETTLHKKQKENKAAIQAAIHTEWKQSEEKQKDGDAKWAAWVTQLQADLAKKQKEASDDHVRRIAELDQQRMQQDEQYSELQQRMHVSESSAQSTILYQCHGDPSVSVHAPPPLPLVLQQLLPMPHLCMPVHVLQASQPKGALFALPQVPVVDFAQQRMIMQIPVMRQESEVARLEQAVRDSVSNPNESVQLSTLLRIASQECCHLKAEFQKKFGAHAAGANGAADGATLQSSHIDQSTAHMLRTDLSGQNVNGQNGAVGHFLDLSAPTFQPVFGDPSNVATNSDLAGLQCLPGSGPMNM